jgi:hypothetical protein
LTVASLLVSTVSLVYSAWRLQRSDFHVKDLWSYSYTLGDRIKQVLVGVARFFFVQDTKMGKYTK